MPANASQKFRAGSGVPNEVTKLTNPNTVNTSPTAANAGPTTRKMVRIVLCWGVCGAGWVMTVAGVGKKVVI
jgi:hypothetical protein